jgi:transcription termination factor Rho
MAVLERSELDASSLADLHAIADQIGLDGFRRLRKAELIDAILARSGVPGGDGGGGAGEDDAGDGAGGAAAAPERSEPATTRRRRPLRVRRARSSRESEGAGGEGAAGGGAAGGGEAGERETGARETREEGEGRTSEPGERGEGRGARGDGRGAQGDGRGARGDGRAARADGRGARGDGRGARDRSEASRRTAERPAPSESREEERIVEGVVELLGNGSAFLRVSPPEASDADLYISAAQVRRCELVSGDRVSGPVRTPRQSERFPSLARVDTINGAPAESVAEGTRYEDLAVVYPCERLVLDAEEPTLKAIEWLTPIGRGSRVAIVGAARSGKTETLRRLLGALAGREGLEVMLVLSGARPEEIAAWREGPVAPAAAVDLAASADLQSQTVEHVVDTAKRVAARGGDVVVLIDSLDGLHPHVARRALAAARNLAEGGSLTVIATATRPLGGESTVIALDVALTSTGRLPALDLAHSGVVRPELLVGEDGAEAITRARASAIAG